MQKTAQMPAYPVRHKLSQPGFSFEVYSSVEDLPLDWEKAEYEPDIFLQRPYLAAVESAPPYGMEFNYLVFYKEEIPIGRAIFQITKFDASRSVQELHHHHHRHSVWAKIGNYFKNLVAQWARFNLLVCGSSLLTGEHGFSFNKDLISREMWLKIIEESGMKVSDYLRQSGLRIDGIFIKDLQGDKVSDSALLEKMGFHEFAFHPCMTLQVHPQWTKFEDYLAAISSKYRVRAKRAFRKAKDFKKMELTEERLEANNGRLYDLYRNVASQASFNMVELGENYFWELKRQLGDSFRIFGYFLEGELIGFYTSIYNGTDLDAHFLGMDGTVNRKSQLYLNMLFDMTREGIEMGKKRIVMARTAMEIKSSVGAQPHEMLGYIRAHKPFINWLLTPILELLRPKDDWVPRQPFKTESEKSD